MRILHVVPYFPPDRIGGVGEMAFHLHRGLLDAGHDSHVVTAGTSTEDRTVERIARSPLGWTFKVAGLARRTADFDVVHCHQGEALALVLAMKALGVRTPVLTTFHVSFREFARAHRPYQIEGRRFGGGWRNLRYRLLTTSVHRAADWMMRRLADAASFISRSSAMDVLGEGRGRAAKVVYNAVPSLGTEATAESAHPDRREGVLYVGNAGDRKRCNVLPFMLRRLHARMPGVQLTLAGLVPDEVPRLVGLFRELGVEESVVWAGKLGAEALDDLYRRASVVVVPSASEGLPMVILEALRAGTPCVATRVSGHPEAIEDGVNGFLVGVDDPGEMAERCARLLSDPELVERMGEAGREVVAGRFDVAGQVAAYTELYSSLA